MGKVIAFIPVRGGSKSIPLKNIRFFCGKPLVFWNIEALQHAEAVDEIIVATDSTEIEKTVRQFGFDKVKIYNRSAGNATDTSSTESVMLEYIRYAGLSESDIFMLVQATSPLTQTRHFAEALDMYVKGEYDSMLTCVRNHRFFWHDDGTPINYDYTHRPRRQDFHGAWMENGAFYINTVKNIVATQNRLSGKTGIYEMPAYTAFELDEPDDWLVMENLMRKHVLNKKDVFIPDIRLVLTDIDGVLTDGGMYYTETGDEMKKFNARDGMAFSLLRKAGIKVGIITSENTQIVANRAKKLKADYLIQGKHEGGKLASAQAICLQEGISLDNVAYIGDDINCFELLSAVGLPACPNDAMRKIKEIAHILILSNKGGDCVFREFAEHVIQLRITN